jgi:hypothetical protein
MPHLTRHFLELDELNQRVVAPSDFVDELVELRKLESSRSNVD